MAYSLRYLASTLCDCVLRQSPAGSRPAQQGISGNPELPVQMLSSSATGRQPLLWVADWPISLEIETQTIYSAPDESEWKWAGLATGPHPSPAASVPYDALRRW